MGLTFLTEGHVLPGCHTTCPCTSLSFHTPDALQLRSMLASLLCNKSDADCSRSPCSLSFFPVFPTLGAPQDTRPLLASVHLAVAPTEGPACAWVHNKIIFALGCWNSADTPWQFHLPWERKGGGDIENLAHTRSRRQSLRFVIVASLW